MLYSHELFINDEVALLRNGDTFNGLVIGFEGNTIMVMNQESETIETFELIQDYDYNILNSNGFTLYY